MLYITQLKSIINKCHKALISNITTCRLCGQRCQESTLLCQFCLNDLPKFDYDICQGNLLSWPAINNLVSSKYVEQLICFAPYQWPYSTWLNNYKYQHNFELSKLISHLLITLWKKQFHEKVSPDLILSVPIHLNRWKTRGFNQSHIIAKEISTAVGIPYDISPLARIVDTPHQVGQSGSARRTNVKKAFQLSFKDYKTVPKHVLLVDDVVTTGTTTNEISKLLKQQGVLKVTVIALCLSLPN